MFKALFRLLLIPAALCHAQKPATFFQPDFLGAGGISYAVADFNGDGNLDVAIAGSDLIIDLGNGKGQFRSLSPLAYPNAQIVAGDFNGDGRQDLVLSLKNQLVFLPGNGDGTFGTQQVIGAFASADIAAADLNGDGQLDLLVSSSTVVALLGNGDGTFQAPIATTAVTTGQIVVADFNVDGIPDFAVTNSANALQVLLGNGDGTFGMPITTSTTGATAVFVAGNFTGHTAPDVAIATLTGIQVLIGQGNGTFSTGPFTATAVGSVLAGDFNGDGKLDLVTTIIGEMAVLINHGDGSFQLPSFSYQAQAATFSAPMAVGRFRKAGALDVISGGYYYRNRGNGKFEDPRAYATPYTGNYSVGSIAAGDFNGDGKTDLIVAGGDSTPNLTVTVFPGDGHGGFGAFQQTSLGSYPANSLIYALVTGDFNNDGKLDIAVSVIGGLSQWLVVLLGNGDGTFGAPNLIPDSGAGNMAVGDFNRDGNLDIAVLQSTGVGIWLGNGDGTFTLKTSASPVTDGYQLIAVDLNRDGNLDLVTPNDVFLGNGDGTFVHTTSLNSYGQAVATADFNGDGIPDLAVCSSAFGTTWIFLGKGDGTFEAPWFYGISAQELLAGDFNHDGIPDLALGSFTPDLLLGKGDGTFSLQVPNIVDTVLVSPFWPMVAADFNGDGRLDLGLVYGTAVINTPIVMAILNTTH